LQFASPQALRRLSEGLEEDAIYWMSAADPASPSGLGLDDLRGEVPPRLASSHLVYHGSRLVVVSRRNGGELEIRVAPDHPHVKAYLQFLKVLLTRGFDPLKAIDVETINSEPAPRSPYAPVIVEEFAATRESKSLRLRRRY
jgi:ATP-dependent Lhr-like helicase